MAGLKLSFLGPPQIERDDELVEIGASKGLALLAYLAVTGQAHSRDSLGTLLWPDSDQSRARTYLRHALWSLKKAVGARWLHTSREQIGFQADDDVWLDVRAFQERVAVAAAHEHAADQTCPDCLAQLEEAVSLYRDGFLTGFTLPDSPAFDEWQFFQAEELRQMLATALEKLVQAHTAQRGYEAAIRYARRWLALDPLHEPVQRALMRLYALAGQQAAALRQYQECARLLDEELGIAPEAETTALYEAIRTRQFEAEDAVAPAAAAAASSRPADRYQMDALLATGAHGEVYRGRDAQSGAAVIVKRLRPDAVRRDKDLVARFLQEAEVLSRLNHPNIVRLLATFERDGQQHLVMEYVAGGSLAQRLEQEPQMPLPEALDIALELADALTRAHHLNIIHRDVKPENVLLAADGTPRLTDFGLARLSKREGRLTAAGTLLGSPAYMSPELLQGAEPDARSDIWSFGVLLFEMLAGERPFAGDQIPSVLVSILNDPAPDVRQFRPEVSPALAHLLQRILVKAPDGRIATMRQVAAELEAIRLGRPGMPEAPREWTVPDAASAPAPARFVAREKELARLEEMLAAALAGRPRVAFILGEAGLGKTALLQAFARRAQENHPSLVVAGGNCNAYTGLGDPYLPFREILALLTADLEAWSQSGALLPENAHRIKRLLPETVRALVETAPDLIDTLVPLEGLLERTATTPLPGETWRRQLSARARSQSADPTVNLQQSALLEQYSRLLLALARRAPLLLLLDDLQWADPGSVSLLFHLGRRLAGSPLLIVGAYRPAEVALGHDDEPHPLARVVAELQRLFGDILIDLSKAEGQAFVDAWLDSEPNRLRPFFRQTLYRQTGGHPLFTIELLRAMRERGDLRQGDDGVWEMQTQINWNTMPARVEGAIGERIQRLEPGLQELLQIASVEGEEFTAEVVARVLQRDERETVRLLSRELDKVHALVQAIGTRRAGGRRLSRYRFRHILIQRYLYHSLDEVERIYQHEAMGNALEALHHGQLAEVAVQLARHYEIAQIPEKAAAYLELAGDQARRTAALGEASRFYRDALSRWPEHEQAERAALMRKLGECQWMTGHAQDALVTFQDAYDLFTALGNTEEAGAMQRLIGRVYWEIGDRENSLRHYRQALSILEPLPESVELAWAISSIAQMHMLASEFEQAISWGERALAMARRLEADAVVVHALNNMGTSHLSRQEVEPGRAMLEESIRLALAENLPHDACRGRLNLAGALMSLDYYEEAREIFTALYAYADRVQATLYATSALIELSRLDWLNGRWRDALARRPLIDEWLQRGQAMAYPRVIASTFFGEQYNDLGQPDAAYNVLEKALPLVQSFDEFQFTGPHLAQMVRALAARGEEAQAVAVARQVLDAVASVGYDSRDTALPMLMLYDALPAPAARALMDDILVAVSGLSQDGMNDRVASRRAALHEVRGMVALLQAKPGDAVASLRAAVAAWQTMERPYDQAQALKKLGQALVQVGEQAEACATFAAAQQRIDALAAQLDDGEAKAAFLQAPLARAIGAGLRELEA